MRKEDIYDFENEIVETTQENGKLEVKYIRDFSERAEKFKRLDRVTKEELNVALEYFDYRCAYSGERFVTFEEKVSAKNTTLSIDHIVALVSGGHNIAQNMVPAIFQYNTLKNGYHLIDWWKKQKNVNNEYIYNPYRMLKIFNFMLKSLQAMELKGEEYREAILTPNEIDRYLSENQEQVYSDNLTTQEIDNDGVDILQKVPHIEYDIAELDEEKRERYPTIELSEFMNNMLMELEDSEIDRDIVVASRSIYNNLANREKVFERIPEEEKIQAKIIEYFKELDCKNVYTIARVIDIPSLLKNSVNVRDYLDEKVQEVRLFLDERKIDKDILPSIIDNVPDILVSEDKNYQLMNVNFEIPENMEEIERLGISVEEKDPKNINAAIEIVETYRFEYAIGREINDNEKKAIIQVLLGQKILNKDGEYYISSLVNNLVEKGMTKEEAYGAVMNYAIGMGNKKYGDVLQSKNKIEAKEEIVIEVTKESINKALLKKSMKIQKNMAKDEIENLDMLEINVEEKDPRNIHTALEIVETYNFEEAIGRVINDNEKKAIIQLLLAQKSLNKDGSKYILTLINNLMEKGMTKKDAYGAVMNYAIGLGNNGYTAVLQSKNKIGEKGEIVIEITKESINEALLQNGMEIPEDTEKLKELGVEMREKDPRNIHTALEIVETYSFEDAIGRVINDNEKKAIIQLLLAQKMLNKDGKNYISTLVNNLMEKGLTKEDAYGSVINYAVGLGNKGYADVLASKSNIREKEEIVIEVTKESINEALLQNGMEIPDDIEKLKELGIDASEKDSRNIHTALEIVEGYNFEEAIERAINNNEKKAIIQLLLGQKVLNKEERSRGYIINLVNNLIEKGLTKEDAYGAVINYAIGSGNKNYSDVLQSKNKIEAKEEIVAEITKGSINEALLKNDMEIPDDIEKLEELEELGIESVEKDPRNIHTALEIVEAYNFEEVIGREINDNEKKAIIQSLLGQKILNKDGEYYISSLVNNLMGKELTKEEAYGAVINYSIGEGNKNYAAVLASKNNIEEKEEILTSITEESIKKAVEKIEKQAKTVAKQCVTKERVAKNDKVLGILNDLGKENTRETAVDR